MKRKGANLFPSSTRETSSQSLKYLSSLYQFSTEILEAIDRDKKRREKEILYLTFDTQAALSLW